MGITGGVNGDPSAFHRDERQGCGFNGLSSAMLSSPEDHRRTMNIALGAVTRYAAAGASRRSAWPRSSRTNEGDARETSATGLAWELRLVLPDPRLRSVRKRLAAQVAALNRADENEAMAWIEAVSEFDASTNGP